MKLCVVGVKSSKTGENQAKLESNNVKPNIGDLFSFKKTGNVRKYNERIQGLALAFLCEGI